MEQFQQLGEVIEKRWVKENYSEELFPQIAEDALLEADLPARVDPWEIIRWTMSSLTLPDQKDVEGRFGNPPITLYSGSRFYIDVYYWLDGTTTVHQHAFCGAFQVLLGSSIHSHYHFELERVLSEHFRVGQLHLRQVQLLKVGDIKRILPGREYIHSLFHLDRPSATITIRTEHTPSAAPQWDYRKPHFATNPFFNNTLMAKRLQTVQLVLGMKHKNTDELIGNLIDSSDFHFCYYLLGAISHHLKGNQVDDLFGMSTGKDRFDTFLERSRDRHGELVDKLLSVFEEQERQTNIILRRGTITGEEHRFFLALLLNVPNREKILELVKQRFPDVDPVEKVLDWVEELSQTRVLGSKEDNALGIEGFGDGHILVLENELRGLSLEEIKKSAASNGEGLPSGIAERVDALSASLHDSSLFKAILK